MPEDTSPAVDDPDRPAQSASPAGDTIIGNKVAGDLVTGDKVMGDKYESHYHLPHSPVFAPRIMLPPRPLHFHGREVELAQLIVGLKPGRIFTVCGPGGMGKTALAAQAILELTGQGAHLPSDFPDGVFFHSFYNQPSIDFALQQLAAFFGEEPRPTPAAAAQRALAGRCVLLVLDGAEAADNLGQILDFRGCCGVLITSRDRAQIYDTGLDLTPLSAESALAVLYDWARAQAADLPAAAAVCELLGRLPLALRLAGGYMASRHQPVTDYAAWLEPALQQGAHRQESMLILFRRSLECLDQDMQAILAVASLLAFAPIDRPLLAAALGFEDARLARALGELVRFSLLQPVDGAYQLVHVLLHTYARQEVHLPLGALERLAAHFIRSAREQSKLGPAGYTALDVALPHLLATLGALQAASAWRPLIDLASSIDGYLDLHGRAAERRQVCELALEASRSLDDHWQQGKWLTLLGLTSSSLGRVTEAIDFYQQALAAFKAIEDQGSAGAVLSNLGAAYAALGEPRQAIDYFQQALEIARQTGNRRGEGVRLGNLGNAYAALGEPRQAIAYHQQALEIARQIGDRRGEGNRLGNLGVAYYELKEIDRSVDYIQQALTIAREIGDRPGEGNCLNNLGEAYQNLGQIELARQCFFDALNILEQVESPIAESARANLSNLPPSS